MMPAIAGPEKAGSMAISFCIAASFEPPMAVPTILSNERRPAARTASGKTVGAWTNAARVRVKPFMSRASSFAAHFGTRPFFKRANDCGHVGIRTEIGLGDREEHAHRIAHHHRHTEPFGFFET